MNNLDIGNKAIKLHKKFNGKLITVSKVSITNKEELSLAYTPGVAAVSKAILKDNKLAKDLTLKGRTIAVVTDGSAVLGLGNVGPEAAIPVMEGKAVLFKLFGGLDAVPLCIKSQETKEIINFVKNIVPTFAGINLEDISAPRCFEIENELMDIGIPVMHDDQHGTAIVVLAALINAAKVVNKQFSDLKVVINGAGAAGIAISRMFLGLNQSKARSAKEEGANRAKNIQVKDLILLDSRGILHKERTDLNFYKKEVALHSNKNNISGDLRTALINADVFIGVSRANLLQPEDIKLMNKGAIVFAMANPNPEIMPEKAKKGGAVVVGSGRSDYPNQVNNLLAFPGIFKGAIDANAKQITNKMKLAAAFALADMVKNPSPDYIIPSVFEKSLAEKIALAVVKAA